MARLTLATGHSPLALYPALRPLLFRLDAERAHGLAVRAAQAGQRVPALVRAAIGATPAVSLRQTLLGLQFDSPLGLAAGFDKNARLVRFWDALGFGWAEVGSVTAEASAGNARPRAFRLPEDGALVNRMGLGNDGAASVADRLAGLPRRAGFVISVNVAKTHRPGPAAQAGLHGAAGVEDVRRAVAEMLPQADLLTLNVSCPNTSDGKTFETPDALAGLLAAVMPERDRRVGRTVPVLVKLSPAAGALVAGRLSPADAEAVETLVAIALGHGVDGLMATNTATDRAGLSTPASTLDQIGRGGLSGRPLASRSLALVRHLYRTTEGCVPIVGVGGMDSAEAAYAMIRAGASLVQIYTALVYRGPGVVREITHGLARLLDGDGFVTLPAAVGVDA